MDKNLNYFIAGEKVFLRSFEPGDELMIAHLENHPDPRATLFYAIPSSPLQQVEKLRNDLHDSSTIIFTICTIDGIKPIGQTKLVRIDWVGRMATFYLGLAYKADWEKGYGSEVVKLMLDYAFNTLNLNRVQLHVAIKNKAAIKVYERSGFVIEGKLREAMYYDGQYWDFLLMAILKKDFLKINV